MWMVMRIGLRQGRRFVAIVGQGGGEGLQSYSARTAGSVQGLLLSRPPSPYGTRTWVNRTIHSRNTLRGRTR